MRFSYRLALLFSSIFVAAFGIVFYLGYTTSARIMKAQVEDRLAEQAYHSMDKIDRMLYERMAEIKAIANDPAIASIGTAPEVVAEELRSRQGKSDFYISLSFFDNKRVIKADTLIGRQNRSASYWPELERDGEFSGVDISDEFKKPMIFVASAVRDGRGSRIGFVVGRVSFERLAEITRLASGVHAQDKGLDVKVDLVDRDGLLLYSNHDGGRLLRHVYPGWPRLSGIISPGNALGSAVPRGPGPESILVLAREQGYMDFKGNDWTLLVQVPAREALAGVILLRNRMLSVMLAICLAAILCIFVFARTVSRPLLALAGAADKVGRGEYNLKVDGGSKDEVGMLARSFTAMAGNLAESREKLLETNERLAAHAEELERRNMEARLLNQMGEFLQVCRSVDEALEVASEFMKALFEGSSGAVFLLNPSRDILAAKASWGSMEAGDITFTQAGCEALRNGQPYVAPPPGQGARCPHLRDYDAPCLCIPMLAHGEPLGVLHVRLGTPAAGREFEAGQMLAMTASEQIALAIVNIRLRETLHELSIRDPLTRLFNRRFMDEFLKKEVSRARRSGAPVGIIMADLDHFKRVNDTLGHECGDAALREVGAFLCRHVRESDVPCRYGGEEFVMIMPETTLDHAVKRAEQIRDGVRALRISHEGRALPPLTVSLGVAVFPEHGDTAESVLQAADAAMYRAKQGGRDLLCTAGEDDQGGRAAAIS